MCFIEHSGFECLGFSLREADKVLRFLETLKRLKLIK
jgi:hypothetical protein